MATDPRLSYARASCAPTSAVASPSTSAPTKPWHLPDRGELERLVDAEQGWQSNHSAGRDRDSAASASGSALQLPHALRRPLRRRRRRPLPLQPGLAKRCKKSFFDELFD